MNINFNQHPRLGGTSTMFFISNLHHYKKFFIYGPYATEVEALDSLDCLKDKYVKIYKASKLRKFLEGTGLHLPGTRVNISTQKLNANGTVHSTFHNGYSVIDDSSLLRSCKQYTVRAL